MFCNQKIKIKGGMQAKVIFPKWNHFWRMAALYNIFKPVRKDL